MKPTLKDAIIAAVASISKENLEFKEYGSKKRQMATTRTQNVTILGAPVPGVEGKVGRLQVTFCANFLDIADAATYQERVSDEAESALAALPVEQRAALLAKYAAPAPQA